MDPSTVDFELLVRLAVEKLKTYPDEELRRWPSTIRNAVSDAFLKMKHNTLLFQHSKDEEKEVLIPIVMTLLPEKYKELYRRGTLHE